MFRPIPSLIFTLLLWSSGYLGLRIALKDYDPGSLALLNYLITSICLLFPFLFFKRELKMNFIDSIKCLLIGAISFGLGNIALNNGANLFDPSVVSFINSQVPITALILSIIFLRESITLSILIGISMSFIGVSIIAYGYSHVIQWQWGIIYLLLANLCLAVYNVFCKSLLNKYHPLDVLTYTTWGGTVFLLYYAPQALNVIPTASVSATLAIVYLGIFPGLLGYLFWNIVLKHYEVSRACLYLYSLPLITTAMSWLFLNEIASSLTIIGGLIALTGSVGNDIFRMKFSINNYSIETK